MMILIWPIIALLVAPLLAILLHRWRPKSGLTWLFSAIIAIICWFVVLLSRLQLPDTLTLGSGAAYFLFPFSLAFVLDKLSWPFSLALIAILVAYIFTSVKQLSVAVNVPRAWSAWPAALLFSGLGLLSIASGNLYTLLLSWAAIDLAWLLLKLIGNSPRQGIHFSFALRVFGLFWAIAAVFSRPGGVMFAFPILNPQTNTLLFIAAMIRIVAIIPASAATPGDYPWKNLNRYLDLVLFASTLTIFSRTANVGISEHVAPFLLAIAAFISLLCSVLWLYTSRDSGSWLPLSIGFSMFSVAGALISGFDASLAWSMALLLAGTLGYFRNGKTRLIGGILILGIIGMTGLPFTPAWQGIRIYPPPQEVFSQGGWHLIFLLAQGFFLGGLLHAWLAPKQLLPSPERWSEIVYPVGLLLLPITQIIILIWGRPGLSNNLQSFPEIILTWAPLTAVGIAFGTLLVRKRTTALESRILHLKSKTILLDGLYRSGSAIQFLGTKMVSVIDQFLQGEAGILWTLLFLLLLFALLISFNTGG